MCASRPAGRTAGRFALCLVVTTLLVARPADAAATKKPAPKKASAAAAAPAKKPSSSRPLTPGLFTEAVSPAGPHTLAPSLTLDTAGRPILTWVERLDSAHVSLKESRYGSDAWRPVRTIVSNPRIVANWADVPSVCALSDSVLAAEWTESVAGGEEASAVRVSVSRDGGATWPRRFTPHRDRAPAEHSFGALTPLPNGAFGIAWLDGRARAADPQGATTLRFATLTAAGEMGPDEVIDDRVCDCCPLATLSISTNPVVFFRDRSDDDTRDIHAIGRNVFGKWAARPVHDDHWTIAGCPVSGASVAARLVAVDSGNDSVHVDPVTSMAVAWYTRAGDSARVFVSFKDPRDASFREPIRVDEGGAMGRPAIAWTGNTGALVAWVEADPAGQRLVVREVESDGQSTPAYTVVALPPGRTSGIPALVATERELVLAWTDDDPVLHVRLATMKLRR